MQSTKNQTRGSGIHARHNPTNDKTVSDDLQNASGNIVAPPRYRLTKLGEQMARLPIDPKIARILLAAKKHDCMAEILVIASALSIQDPRERPLRTRLRRRVYPTVFRRRLQQPSRIHRPRNRPQQPVAAVILRMAALKLGDVAAFPFLEMPDSRYINDGFQVLLELGAVEAV